MVSEWKTHKKHLHEALQCSLETHRIYSTKSQLNLLEANYYQIMFVVPKEPIRSGKKCWLVHHLESTKLKRESAKATEQCVKCVSLWNSKSDVGHLHWPLLYL